MKHIKIIVFTLILSVMSLAIGCGPAMSTSIEDNIDELIGYYDRVEVLNDWEALGLARLIDVSARHAASTEGKASPTDYARIILGNMAAGKEAIVNEHVTELQGFQREDGSIKIADADTLNNTVWSVIALETARINGYQSIINYDRDKALAYIAANQLDDGSFDGSGWGAESDSTAQALIALSYDREAFAIQIEKGLDYIESTQTEADILPGTWGPSVESAAVYIEALIALDKPVDQKVLERLCDFQLPDGSFYPLWDTEKETNQMTTYLVLNALSDYHHLSSKYHAKFVNENGNNESPGSDPDSSPGTNTGGSPDTPIITPLEPAASITQVTMFIRSSEKYIVNPVTIRYSGQRSVYNLLLEVLDKYGVSYRASSGYVSEIAGLKERQPGYPMSGWLFLVNDEIAVKGSASCCPENGDRIEWVYTLDGGKDILPLNLQEDLLSIDEIELAEKQKTKPLKKIALNTDLRKSFIDIDSVVWAKDAIEIMAGNHILFGTQKGFEPNRYLTRAELTAIILRIQGMELVNTTAPFNDIDNEAWYYNDVGTAVSTGLIPVLPGASFNPDKPATRGDAAFYLAMTDKAALQEHFELPFINESIPDWLKKAAAYAASKGYIEGYPDGTFRADNRLTRAEAAVCLYHYLIN